MTNYIFTRFGGDLVWYCEVRDYSDGTVRINIALELNGQHVDTLMFNKEGDSVTLHEIEYHLTEKLAYDLRG